MKLPVETEEDVIKLTDLSPKGGHTHKNSETEQATHLTPLMGPKKLSLKKTSNSHTLGIPRVRFRN